MIAKDKLWESSPEPDLDDEPGEQRDHPYNIVTKPKTEKVSTILVLGNSENNFSSAFLCQRKARVLNIGKISNPGKLRGGEH